VRIEIIRLVLVVPVGVAALAPTDGVLWFATSGYVVSSLIWLVSISKFSVKTVSN
jgi:hypothetical protein